MSDRLPEFIDPLLLADRRGVLSGAINIAAFERLSDLVAESSGHVDIEVSFSRQGKLAVVSGTVKSALALVCQSCLQPLPWSMDIAFKSGVVSSLEEGDRLGLDCEPLLFDGEKLSLINLIEDEILLALPDYPKHGYDCMNRRQSESSDYNEQDNVVKADNPFSVLAKLKKNTGE